MIANTGRFFSAFRLHTAYHRDVPSVLATLTSPNPTSSIARPRTQSTVHRKTSTGTSEQVFVNGYAFRQHCSPTKLDLVWKSRATAGEVLQGDRDGENKVVDAAHEEIFRQVRDDSFVAILRHAE